MNNEFRLLLRVRYSECDAQKVVFNGRYVDYIDVAAGEYMRVIWGDYNDILERGIDNQVVSLKMDWKAPACFDDIIAIAVSPAQIGSSSYTLKIDFYNHSSGDSIASCEITYVMVSTTDYEKMEIPQNLREKLERGAPGVVIDQTGTG